MTKLEFKTTFIKNLRFYLPIEHKECTIFMRIARSKKDRKNSDTEISSVRTVTHEGFTWRVETRVEIPDLSQLMLYAHYKTADVSWDYKGKGTSNERY